MMAITLFVLYFIGCIIAFILLYIMFEKDMKQLKKSKIKYNPEYGYIFVGSFCSWFTVFVILYNHFKYKD
jgi:NADH:ubiquinone oxidoreductase subunit 6 (subunit J)